MDEEVTISAKNLIPKSLVKLERWRNIFKQYIKESKNLHVYNAKKSLAKLDIWAVISAVFIKQQKNLHANNAKKNLPALKT